MPRKDDSTPTPSEVIASFLSIGKVKEGEGEIFVGIDPGAEGAISIMCGRLSAVTDIPTVKLKRKRIKETTAEERLRTGHKTKTVKGSTTKYDFASILEVFKALEPFKRRVTVVLEEVPFKTSKCRGYTYADVAIGRAYAMWPLFLYSCGYSVEEVKPTWKHKLGLFGKDKEASRLKAISLFPDADLARKQDHDRAEALLMVEYVKRMRSSGGENNH